MIDILYNNCTLKLYRRGLICKTNAAHITLVTTCSLNKSK